MAKAAPGRSKRGSSRDGDVVTSVDDIGFFSFADKHRRRRPPRPKGAGKGPGGGWWLIAALALGYLPALIASEQRWGAVGLGGFLGGWAVAWYGALAWLVSVDGRRSAARAASAGDSERSRAPEALTLDERFALGASRIYNCNELDRSIVDVRTILSGTWLGELDDSELEFVHGDYEYMTGLAIPASSNGQVWEWAAVSNEEFAHRRNLGREYIKEKDRSYPLVKPLLIAGPSAVLPPGLPTDWVPVPEPAPGVVWSVPRSSASVVWDTVNAALWQELGQNAYPSVVIHVTRRFTLVSRAVAPGEEEQMHLIGVGFARALWSTKPPMGSAAEALLNSRSSKQISKREVPSLLRLGSLSVPTATRGWAAVAWFTAAMTLVFSSLPFIGLAQDGTEKHDDWHALMVIESVWVGLMVTTGIFGFVRQRRLERRQAATGLAIMTLVDEQGFTFVKRDKELSQGWRRPPFATTSRLTCEPSARKTVDGVEVGVAYLEGDLGVGPFSRPLTSRVAWAKLPEGAPSLDIIPEGFSARLAKLFGGSDLEVESVDFNRSWRVLASDARAAHALLAPTVIAAVDEVAALGLALHIDAGRVMVWDDGRAFRVDLERRLQAVEKFARLVPSVFR